ncbi:MAG TPA: hypothetical protein VIN06_15340 [Devosia sp.]
MLSDFVDKFTSFWGRSDEPEIGSDDTPEERQRRAQRGFVRRLVLLADSRPQGRVVAGTIAVAGMDILPGVLGERWHAASDRVADVVSAVLSRLFLPPDFYTRHEAAALICFFTPNLLVAEHRLGAVAREIESALILNLGEDAEHFHAEHFVAELTLDEAWLREAGDPVPGLLERLQRIRQEARTRPSSHGWFRSARLSFQPLWEVAEARTGANLCSLEIPGAVETLHQLEPAVGSASVADALARIDFVTLVRAFEALEESVREHRPVSLMLPVHASTLTLPHWRDDYLQPLVAATDEVHEALHFELLGGPDPENAAAAIGDAVALLLDMAESIVVRLTPDLPQPLRLPLGKIDGLSFDLGGLGRLGSLKRPLAALTRYAKRQGLVTYALGANTIAEAQVARDAGFAFIAGAAIHARVREPRFPTRLAPLPTARPPRWVPVLPN